MLFHFNDNILLPGRAEGVAGGRLKTLYAVFMTKYDVFMMLFIKRHKVKLLILYEKCTVL